MPCDLGEHLLVVLAASVTGWFVCAEERGGDHKRERHPGLTGARSAADPVRVGFGAGREVEVEDTGHVLEVDAAGYTVFFVAAHLLALLFGGLFGGRCWVCFGAGGGRAGCRVRGFRGFFGFRVVRFCVVFFVAQDFVFVRGDDDLVDVLVEFVDDVDAGVDRQFRVQNTAPDPELLEKQLKTVASVDVADKDDAFALDQFQFEDDVDQEELFVFSASIRGR